MQTRLVRRDQGFLLAGAIAAAKDVDDVRHRMVSFDLLPDE
jgi:hypothetical protein